jgi:hypothetical protein
MEIGSLEYVVIDVEDSHFTREILPKLKAIQASGAVRIVDLMFVDKDLLGTTAVWGVNELNDEERQPYQDMLGNLKGLSTAQDAEKLAQAIPLGTSAVIVLLEHTWALDLAKVVRQAGGMLFNGGIVTPDALAQVGAELATARR